MKKELRFEYENLRSVNGKYCTVKFLSKYMPQQHQDTLDFIEKQQLSHLPFEQGLFLFMNGMSEPKRCKCCDNFLKFESFNYGYITIYCSAKCKANDPEMIIKTKITNLDRYGSEYVGGSKTIQDKIKKTTKERWGVKNVFELTNFNKFDFESYQSQRAIQKKENNIISKTTTIITRNNKFKEKHKDINFINSIGDIVSFKCGCEKNKICEMSKATFMFRYKNNIPTCNHCNPVDWTFSYAEQQIFEFIQTVTKDEILTKNRKIIKPKELDIYIPSKKLAIEYDGLYWHSDIHNLSTDHIDKTFACEKQNIRLIHIFEDEWLDKSDIVKSILSHIFNSPNQQIVRIKNCEIKMIDNETTKNFFLLNSLDYLIITVDNQYYNFGIYYNNELIGIVTFKTKDQRGYELYFATKNNCKVDIMPVIQKFSNINNVITTSVDRRYPTRSFILNNFDLIESTEPDFYYVDKHNTPIAKRHKSEVTLPTTMPKIYDCGRRIYQLKK